MGIGDDLLVTSVPAEGPKLKPVQGRVRGQRLALVPLAQPSLSEHVGLARDQRMERIESQPVVVVEIFVAESGCPDALTQKLGNLVFDQAWEPIVRKTPAQPLNESHLQADSTQKHAPPSLLR